MTLNYDLQTTKEKVNLMFSVGELQEAETLVKSMLTKHQNHCHFYNLLGLVYHKQSLFPQAIEVFTKGIKASPESPEPKLGLAITLCDIGEYDKATQLMEQMQTEEGPLENAPQDAVRKIIQSHLETSRLYEQIDMLEKSQEEINKALVLAPEDYQCNLSLAKNLYQQKKWDQAKSILEVIVEDHHSSEGYMWLGLVFFKKGEKASAKTAWEKAHEIDPQNPSILAYRDQMKDDQKTES